VATPGEKLASSLEVLRELQTGGQRVFKSDQFTRVHRERLLRHGFLRPIIKGWVMSTSPDTAPGDTTPWHASFWDFCARYCADRFGSEWHLSPEMAALIHAEATAIPEQVVIYSPQGTNNSIDLLFDTSLYDLMTQEMPGEEELVWRDGVRLLTPAAALVRVSGSFLHRHPVEARVLLGMVPDASDLLRPLLDGGHSAVAGRLAGAFRRAGRGDVAQEILRAMSSAGYDVREADPFSSDEPLNTVRADASPMLSRLEGLWNSLRDGVVAEFPPPPGRPRDVGEYLRLVDDIYQTDAYHSLSIEGYSVTPELVERVRSGDWDPEARREDREQRDAMAARGYWRAFQSVKDSVAAVLGGSDPGAVARESHRDWYRQLFQPFVAAGLIGPAALAGYRSAPVYIRDSRHVPPRAKAVRDAMPALFDLLENETEPSVRAVLGHWLVGYVHPYPDGNGRIARFLMNVMLAAGGYPWTVIRVEDRDQYLATLESASVDSEIRPFARFLGERTKWSHELTQA